MYIKDKDQRDFEEFYKENVNLLHSALHPFLGLDCYDDLFSTGLVGFIKGFCTYNPEYGVRKTTYIYKCTVNEIRCYLRKGCTQSRSATVISLDAPATEDGRCSLLDQNLEVYDPVKQPYDVEAQVHKRMLFDSAIDILKEEMSPVQQYIVFQFLNGIPQSKTATALGVSQSKISKTLKQTMQALRDRLGDIY